MGLDLNHASQRRLRAELPELVPNGLLVTRSWLMEQGLARHAVDNLVKSGQLLPLRPGVYIRPGSRLVWQGRRQLPSTDGRQLRRRRNERAGAARSDALSAPGSPPRDTSVRLRTSAVMGQQARSRGDVPSPWHTAWLWEPEESAECCEQRPLSSFTVDVPWGDGFQAVRTSTLERALLEILKDVRPGYRSSTPNN